MQHHVDLAVFGSCNERNNLTLNKLRKELKISLNFRRADEHICNIEV